MTLHSTSSALGSQESAARTRGRRKRVAERIEYGEVTGAYPTCPAYLIGSCGHTLRWLASVPVRDGEPQTPVYLTGKIGRRMTCEHDDCRIP
jgi:hypothetical protein